MRYNYPEGCEGCILLNNIVDHVICMIYTDSNLASACPCSKCLIKSMCTKLCDERREYRDRVYREFKLGKTIKTILC
jgi:hypothetical protein